jgi:tripartite-type tricarboxylate transporter receptor subunit TctC
VVATAAVASADDGHTFLLATEGLALNVRLHPDQPDPRTGLTPVMLMTRSSLSITAAPGSSYRTLPELIAEAKRRPGEISYGSSGGTATVSNLVMVALQATAGIKLLHVPYASGPQAVQASIAKHTALASGTSFLVRPYVDSGRLQALAVTSLVRNPSMPMIPTLAELGFPELTTYAWWGLLAPRSAPSAVVAYMHTELTSLLASQAMKDTLVQQGMEIVSSTPLAFAGFLDAEVTRWGNTIDKNNVRAGE